jgi:hypothetical protein
MQVQALQGEAILAADARVNKKAKAKAKRGVPTRGMTEPSTLAQAK